MLVVICPGFGSNFCLKNNKTAIFGNKELAPKPLSSLAICAKSSSNLPIMEETYRKFQIRWKSM
jgi:hypothetical protein